MYSSFNCDVLRLVCMRAWRFGFTPSYAAFRRVVLSADIVLKVCKVSPGNRDVVYWPPPHPATSTCLLQHSIRAGSARPSAKRSVFRRIATSTKTDLLLGFRLLLIELSNRRQSRTEIARNLETCDIPYSFFQLELISKRFCYSSQTLPDELCSSQQIRTRSISSLNASEEVNRGVQPDDVLSADQNPFGGELGC